MDESPRRPLILRKRKLPLEKKDVHVSHDGPNRPQCIPENVRVMDHPSMPDTQVLIIPKTADLQSVIDTLTARGKERGPEGPNKFILLSRNSSEDKPESLCQPSLDIRNPGPLSTQVGYGLLEKSGTDCQENAKPLTAIKPRESVIIHYSLLELINALLLPDNACCNSLKLSRASCKPLDVSCNSCSNIL